MKLITIGLTSALAIGTSALLVAQAPEHAPSAEAGKSVTLIGCVQSGSTPAQFVLASATRAPELTLGLPGARETAPAEKALRYDLVADGQDLKKLLGHKVEATGSVSAAAKPSTEARPNVERPQADRPGTAAPAMTFTATSIKEVASAC